MDTAKAILVISLVGLVLPLLILIVRDRVGGRRSRTTPDQDADAWRERQERILKPDWEFYERHLQRPVPPALRELYADHELITASSFDYSEDQCINTFSEISEDWIIDTREIVGFDAVPIAWNDFGDPIYLKPGPNEPNVVYITYHDGGDTEVFASSLDAMLKQLRLVVRMD